MMKRFIDVLVSAGLVRSRHRLLLVLATVAVGVLGFGPGIASAAPTVINFDSLTGPSLFGSVDPPLTIGVATFSGGKLMTAVTGTPADQTSIYGTASFCTGCAPAITIGFSTPVSGFSTDVINGVTSTVSYTVLDNLGGIVTKTLVANFSAGKDTFSLPDVGITSVTIAPTAPSSLWDFFIDNVAFTPVPGYIEVCKAANADLKGQFRFSIHDTSGAADQTATLAPGSCSQPIAVLPGAVTISEVGSSLGLLDNGATNSAFVRDFLNDSDDDMGRAERARIRHPSRASTER